MDKSVRKRKAAAQPSPLASSPMSVEEKTGEIPEFVLERLEAQRARLWQIQGIIESVRAALDANADAHERNEQPYWWALWAAADMADDVAHRLDPAVITEVPHG